MPDHIEKARRLSEAYYYRAKRAEQALRQSRRHLWTMLVGALLFGAGAGWLTAWVVLR